MTAVERIPAVRRREEAANTHQNEDSGQRQKTQHGAQRGEASDGRKDESVDGEQGAEEGQAAGHLGQLDAGSIVAPTHEEQWHEDEAETDETKMIR